MNKYLLSKSTIAFMLAISACASTEMRTFVGKPIEEALFAYGKPEQVIDLGANSRAFQFRWGGGTAVIPATSTSTASSFGSTVTVNTTATPAMLYESAGCLITFITEKRGNSYTITDYRIPKKLIC